MPDRNLIDPSGLGIARALLGLSAANARATLAGAEDGPTLADHGIEVTHDGRLIVDGRERTAEDVAVAAVALVNDAAIAVATAHAAPADRATAIVEESLAVLGRWALAVAQAEAEVAHGPP